MWLKYDKSRRIALAHGFQQHGVDIAMVVAAESGTGQHRGIVGHLSGHQNDGPVRRQERDFGGAAKIILGHLFRNDPCTKCLGLRAVPGGDDGGGQQVLDIGRTARIVVDATGIEDQR